MPLAYEAGEGGSVAVYAPVDMHIGGGPNSISRVGKHNAGDEVKRSARGLTLGGQGSARCARVFGVCSLISIATSIFPFLFFLSSELGFPIIHIWFSERLDMTRKKEIKIKTGKAVCSACRALVLL